MPELQGHVSIISFADLLQHLVGARKWGTLVLQQGSKKKTIHIGPKGMRLLHSTTKRGSSLGEIMIRTGKINRAQLDKLLLEQRRTGKRLGELVNRQGIVTRKDVENALREQAEEEIYDVFMWNNASFEFIESEKPPEHPDFILADVLVDASPTGTLLEAARRADEIAVIKKVIPNETLIPMRTTNKFSPEGHDVSADLINTIYRLINGRLDIRDVINNSMYPKFQALQAIYILAKKDFIKILDREGATAIHLKASETRRIPRKGSGAAVAPSPYAVPAGKSRQVLLMGDMVKYREVLASMLRSAGYLVIEDASNTGPNVLLNESNKVNGIIMDVGHGTEDDYQLVSWLCTNTKVPVVILSDNPSREAAMTAVKKGAKAYVAKPFTSESMLRALSGVF